MTSESGSLGPRGGGPDAYDAVLQRWTAVLECVISPTVVPRGLEAAHHVARVARRNTMVRESVRITQLLVEYAGIAVALQTVYDRNIALFVALGVHVAAYVAINIAVELPWALRSLVGLARPHPSRAWREDVTTGAVLLGLIIAPLVAALTLPTDRTTRTLLLVGTGTVAVHLALLALIERIAWAVRRRQLFRDAELGVADPLVSVLDDLDLEGALTEPAIAHSVVELLELAVRTMKSLSGSAAAHADAYGPRLPQVEQAIAALTAAPPGPRTPADGAIAEALEVEIRELATALLLDVLEPATSAASVPAQGSPTDHADHADHADRVDRAGPSRLANTFANTLAKAFAKALANALVWVSHTLRSNDPRATAIATSTLRTGDTARAILLPAGRTRSGSRQMAWASVTATSLVAVLRADWTSTPDLPRLALFVAACGVATMMIIESVKALFPIRAVHHRRHLLRWLTDRLGDQDGDEAGRQLISLLNAAPRSRSGGRRSGFTSSVAESLFNLPPELFLAQVSLAVERALTSRAEYRLLLEAFAPAPDPRHLSPASAGAILDRANDLPMQLAASFNQLQAWLTESWRLVLRVMSWILSGLVAVLAVTFLDRPAEGSSLYILATLAFGGIVAGLSRDVLAVLERLRPR